MGELFKVSSNLSSKSLSGGKTNLKENQSENAEFDQGLF